MKRTVCNICVHSIFHVVYDMIGYDLIANFYLHYQYIYLYTSIQITQNVYSMVVYGLTIYIIYLSIYLSIYLPLHLHRCHIFLPVVCDITKLVDLQTHPVLMREGSQIPSNDPDLNERGVTDPLSPYRFQRGRGRKSLKKILVIMRVVLQIP